MLPFHRLPRLRPEVYFARDAHCAHKVSTRACGFMRTTQEIHLPVLRIPVSQHEVAHVRVANTAYCEALSAWQDV